MPRMLRVERGVVCWWRDAGWGDADVGGKWSSGKQRCPHWCSSQSNLSGCQYHSTGSDLLCTPMLMCCYTVIILTLRPRRDLSQIRQILRMDNPYKTSFKKAFAIKRTLGTFAYCKISTRPTVLHIAQVAEEASTHPPFIPEAPK